MTDGHTDELLSRYIDDDLEPRERVEIERRLEADPALVCELEALVDLRAAISELAGGMTPPARLEAMLEPIRRAVPPRTSRLPPAVRWMATAAAIVVGLAVVIELARRTPPEPARRSTGPRPRATVPADHDRSIFQLRPLPTSSVPEERAPLGVADRLVASPLPDPELPRPEPLDIIGPLPEAPDSTARAVESTAPSAAATLLVRLADQSATRPVVLREPLPVGSYRLVLGVAGELVVTVHPERRERTEAVLVRRAVVGTRVNGIPDGNYLAELTVEAAPDQ